MLDAGAAATSSSGAAESAASDDLPVAHEPANGQAATRLAPSQSADYQLGDGALGQTIGAYKLREKLGEGGGGVVYVAEQEEPVRRRVALKLIKPGMDSKQVITRFEAERQALAMMDHPNIARVLDGGATEIGRPYFVMELVRGLKITDYCDQTHLSTRKRIELFINVCRAVQHAHQKGIIHRDLKPSNILVTLHDGVPVPKVIDFGIAKATEGRLTNATVYTQLNQLLGTPAYMSPEQAEMSGLDIDTRSDIYSLGVLLYELLAGSTPFDARELLASGLDAMRKTIREKEPVRPSTRLATLKGADSTTTAKHRTAEVPQLIHQLRGDLDWIVMKCLEKDRARRYETANGLAADLQRHLHNEPVVARPASTAYRLQKAWRRNTIAFSAAAAIAVTLFIGVMVSTWQAVEARKARNAEREQRVTAQAERDKAQTAQRQAESAQEAEKTERLRADAEKTSAQRHLYVANMTLAQQSWELTNLTRFRQLLDETKASPARGFEWYYWQRHSHLASKTLRGHTDRVNCVTFSPDGQRIATGCWDKTAKVWDAASGRELLTLEGHTARISSVAFSPDGQRIVTGSGDQTARIWDSASGRELHQLKGHAAEVWSVAFSVDGQWIVTGSEDQTARIWEAASGRELLTLKGHGKTVFSAAFSPDRQRIVTGSGDRTAKVWDATSGRELLTLKGHSSEIFLVEYSRDGRQVVTGSPDWTAKTWDAANGRELVTFKGHRSWVLSVAFSPDGQRIITGSGDQTAKVWDVTSGRELLTLKGHVGSVHSVAFSPDGQRIVTGGYDQTSRVWEATGDGGPLTLQGHNAPIESVAFSPDGQRIVTAGGVQPIRVWDSANGRESLTLKMPRVRTSSVAFSPDGQRIAAGSGDHLVHVWDAVSGRELLSLKGLRAPVWTVAFSPDSRQIVTGSGELAATVWEVAGGRELRKLKGHHGPIRSAVFSPDGQRILTGSLDQTAKVWETANGRELLTLKGHSAFVLSVAFSPDGQRIATASWDQTARVWDAASGRELLTLKGHSAPVLSVAFSPDSQRIVTGGADRTATVWDAVGGRELLKLKAHRAPVSSVAFSADGKRIVTGSEDQTAVVWEAAEAGQVLAWQDEELAAEQRMSALERERTTTQENQRIPGAGDEGAIKHWLILGPITSPTSQAGTLALGSEQIKDEGSLRPRAGQTVALPGGELKWQEMVSDDPTINFNASLWLWQASDRSVAYAVCYIRSAAEQRDLRMLVGCDDQGKVYLNGKQVHSAPIARGFVADQDTVPGITLQAGLNVLVFKVVNEGHDWQGSIRLTDAKGNPVEGIQMTVDPDGK